VSSSRPRPVTGLCRAEDGFLDFCRMTSAGVQTLGDISTCNSRTAPLLLRQSIAMLSLPRLHGNFRAICRHGE